MWQKISECFVVLYILISVFYVVSFTPIYIFKVALFGSLYVTIAKAALNYDLPDSFLQLPKWYMFSHIRRSLYCLLLLWTLLKLFWGCSFLKSDSMTMSIQMSSHSMTNIFLFQENLFESNRVDSYTEQLSSLQKIVNERLEVETALRDHLRKQLVQQVCTK